MRTHECDGCGIGIGRGLSDRCPGDDDEDTEDQEFLCQNCYEYDGCYDATGKLLFEDHHAGQERKIPGLHGLKTNYDIYDKPVSC